MLKLIIVEDEMLVRLGLKTTVDWNSLGFEIVGEAEDGEAALQLARELRPDLVITDISMPRMDGLELIKALKIELPFTKVLVLSCHKDYEYVREAMQNYGALDYLLKIKLKPDELKRVMQKARETIEEERKKKGEYLDLQWLVNSNQYHLKGKLFNDLLDMGGIVPSDIFDRLQFMKINLEDDHGIPVCVLLDNYYEINNDKNLLQFSILNICSEVIEGNGCKGEAFHRRDGEFGIFLLFKDMDNEAERKAYSICKQLQANYKMYLNVSVSFGIGKEFKGIEGFSQAYQTALDAACERFYSGKGGIYKSGDSAGYSNKHYYNFPEERAIRLALEERKKTEVQETINALLAGMGAEKAGQPSKVMEELKEILNTFASHIRNYGSNLKELKDENGRELYDSLACCETIEEVRVWFEKFAEQYFGFLDSLSSFKYSREVNRALEYIAAHYNENIGLQEMADYLHLNVSYFSFAFKKETGQNFTDYLNWFRIEKAKEYLRMPGVSVSDVWEKVGYSSLSYFSRVFKQLCSIGPSEYKKNIQKN